MSFFKAYDMRGEFGRDFDLETVFRVGCWLPHVVGASKFLVGRDARASSVAIRDALVRGLERSGCMVDDMGLTTTPMVYFHTDRGGYEASVQITASHNPASHNGMKVSRSGAIPVGYATGLAELEQRVMSGELPPVAEVGGSTREVEGLAEFVSWLKGYRGNLDGLRVAVDCSNGMAGLLARDLIGEGQLYLNEEIDGSFPNHAPNPLEVENCAQLMAAVVENKMDIGVIFDGDADRVMFIDEKGGFIQPDYLIPLIARRYVESEPGAGVIYDIRTSRGVIEGLAEMGATLHIGKVGHAFAKMLLRESGAACGGELAGHYYFRDFTFCDSGELAALLVLDEVAAAKRRGVSFSELVAPYMKYANSGELNFLVSDKERAVASVLAASEAYGECEREFDFDGVRRDYAEWWFNVRLSNTEPYLRLVAEAVSEDMLEERLAVLRKALAPYITG